MLTPEEHGAAQHHRLWTRTNPRSDRISEIPSALRSISHGAMGYSDEHFEWVLGPTERFRVRAGVPICVQRLGRETISGVSTPSTERSSKPFQRFPRGANRHCRPIPDHLPAPLWCSWSNLRRVGHDLNMREMADLAAQAGSSAADRRRVDRGPSWDCGDAEHDPAKFPDFGATSSYIRSKGLELGLLGNRASDGRTRRIWQAMPDARSLPEIKREAVSA